MTDRIVHQIDQSISSRVDKRLFSHFNDDRNLVLLGDPGAGKTHLFKHFADLNGGRYITARDFLNVSLITLQGEKYLFIDALDEKRSGRGVDNVMDAIAARLAELTFDHVRLACRAADWLGDYDLSALKAVLYPQDVIKVLVLEKLSCDEQEDLLLSIGEAEPETFLIAAKKRGLESMLENPQTLKMLWEQVGARSWPATRQELFANSIELLVSEHNLVHKIQSSIAFTLEERLEAAGAACALRLISDIKGIGLREVSQDYGFPSYSDVSLTPKERLLSVLSTRLFIADETGDTADYLHRTLAEFIAARWLAAQIRVGLPFGRVKALITHEGTPTTELRGLNAWLAVHLQEHALELIDADPFGVMTYGDAATLSSEARLHLINALSKLAERDPWFRSGHWDTPVSGLGQPDLVPKFREILSGNGNSLSLRSIVLDAIYEGLLAGEMLDILSELAQNSLVGNMERISAIDAMLQVGELGRGSVLGIYSQLSNVKNDLYVRSHIIRSLYGKGVGPSELCAILLDALVNGSELQIGTLWRLESVIPDDDIVSILEGFTPIEVSSDEDHDYHNNSDVVQFVDALICRAVGGSTAPSPEILLNWLNKRARIGHHYNRESSERLRKVLSENRTLLTKVTEFYLANSSTGEPWHVMHTFERLMTGAADWSIILKVTCSDLHIVEPAIRPFYLEIALMSALRVGPSASAEFDSLLSLRDQSMFAGIIERYATSKVPEWQTKNLARRVRREAERQEFREQRQQNFKENLDAILEGRHLGWMEFLGLIYFSKFSDLDAEASPIQRLNLELGVLQAQQALTAIEKFACEGLYPSVEKVLELHAQDKYQKYWFAVIAGLCEFHEKGKSLDFLDEDRLRSALIIDRLHPTFTTKGNVSSERQHAWKSDLLERRPAFVADVYYHLVRAQLSTGKEHVFGLHELVCYEQLVDVRSKYVIQLLWEFPVCKRTALEHLIVAAFPNESNELSKLIPLGRDAATKAGNFEAWVVWTAFGLLLDVPDCLEDIKGSDEETGEKLIWAIRDAFGSFRKPVSQASRPVTEFIEEFVIQFVGSRISWTEHPDDGWSGDTNPWDATNFVVERINKLAGLPTKDATDALGRLTIDNLIGSYRQCLLHASAKQRIQRADANFKRLLWFEVQETLKGGAPANVDDLQALVITHIHDIGRRIIGRNTDPYKQFWNVTSYGHVKSPKPEEDCRDNLVEMLRPLLAPLGLNVEPEGHMSSDKRADVCIFANNMKLVIELKRDYHPELWTAVERQLERFYTRDPECQGLGIYGVFWFGDKRPRMIPAPPNGSSRPESAEELEELLTNEISDHLKPKIKVFVFNVSGQYD
ncbi:MAG: hypothetical protein WEB02_05790 [Methylophaga sp.]